MCSFIFTNKPLQGDNLNFLSSKRGPDHTESTYIDGFNIIHNLLDISKRKVIQPINKNNITILFNGEIYTPRFECDTLGIIPLYEYYGPSFIEHVNGEYAILILDKNKNIIYLYSDVFATKPLFYCIEDNKIGVASYSSELKILGFTNIKRVSHSTYIEINLSDLSIKEYKHNLFNLNEYKTNYEDCINALELSLNLRCNTKVAVGLSSGHDSGSILLWSILNNKIDNVFYYVTNGREDSDVMRLREEKCIKHNLSYKIIDYYKTTNISDRVELNILSKNMEEFLYFYDENAVCQISNLLRCVKSDGIDIIIIGQGADELMSNYKDYNFFKDYNLKKQFPWANFYEGKNRKFIDEFEYVGGVYGVEVRYPFLDKYFVQEFLNLTNNLKGIKFKAVLNEYMSRNNFPMNTKKVGMGILNYRYFNKIPHR